MGILKHTRNEIKTPVVEQVKEVKKASKPVKKEGDK